MPKYLRIWYTINEMLNAKETKSNPDLLLFLKCHKSQFPQLTIKLA